MRFDWIPVLAFGAVMAAALAPAAAGQTPPSDETACIYDAMSDDDLFGVVDDFFAPTTDTARTADAIFLKARTACLAKYPWTKKQADAAESIALNGAIVDVLSSMLETEEHADQVFDIWDSLAVEEQYRFADDGWSKDAVFTRKVSDKLAAAGLSKESGEIDDALTIMESVALANALTASWPKD